MKPAVLKDELPAKPKRCYSSLGVGVILAGIAAVAVSVDYANNVHFGEKVSEEMGKVMGLAAIALTALPAAAVMLGRWDWRLKCGTIFCAVLTVLAAVSAYSDKQGQDILARQGAADAYQMAQANAEAARREISEAKAAADRIAETAAPDDLESMAKLQRDLIDKETKDRGGCGKRCREAEEMLKGIMARIPDARAKAQAMERVSAAQSRLDKAQQATAAGPAEQTMLATSIGKMIDRDPVDVARAISLTTTTASIIVTLMLALLAEQSMLLIMKGLAIQGVSADAVEVQAKPAAAVRKMGRRKKERSTGELLRKFVAEVCQPGKGECTGAQMHEAFEIFWIANAPGRTKPSNRAVSDALAGAGISKEKRGGRVRYAALVA